MNMLFFDTELARQLDFLKLDFEFKLGGIPGHLVPEKETLAECSNRGIVLDIKPSSYQGILNVAAASIPPAKKPLAKADLGVSREAIKRQVNICMKEMLNLLQMLE